MYTFEKAQYLLLLPIARWQFGPLIKEISVYVILYSLKISIEIF